MCLASTPQKYMDFLGELNPFSNFHRAPFTIQGVTGCYVWEEHLDSFHVILELMWLSVYMTANGYDKRTPSSCTFINQALIM